MSKWLMSKGSASGGVEELVGKHDPRQACKADFDQSQCAQSKRIQDCTEVVLEEQKIEGRQEDICGKGRERGDQEMEEELSNAGRLGKRGNVGNSRQLVVVVVVVVCGLLWRWR